MKTMSKIMLALVLMVAGMQVSAQETSNLKDNTMTGFKSGVNEVKFKSQGVMLAGLLFTPEDFDASKQYPTVVFSGPLMQVKEQMGSNYARKMAQLGYVFLTFDHIGFGDSEGKIRNSENSYAKMEGIRDAVSYVSTLDFVDKARLYGVGGCASGGYMPLVATTDKRFAAIATVSGMCTNKAAYFGNMTREQTIAMFTAQNQARQRMYETGKVEYSDTMGYENVDPETLNAVQREGYDYYMTKRAGTERFPNYSHRGVANDLEVTLLSNAIDYAEYLYTPYLGIYGEKAVTAKYTTDFYEKASEPKELYEVPGASHVSLYDIDKDVDSAVAKMDEFFKKYSK